MKNKAKKITIDELAMMTRRGFDEVGKSMKQGFALVNNNIRILSENNTREHEDIKLRLDNVAYRFELVNLEKRVDVLEKRAGVKKN